MPSSVFRPLLPVAFIFGLIASGSTPLQSEDKLPGIHSSKLTLRSARTSPLDLELGGDLRGVPAGETRYLTRDDLLSLPQETYTVDDDANFKGSTQISGVPLEELTSRFSAAPQSDMVIALCSDLYHGNYPRAYMSAHRPLLVLKVNGQAPSDWPKDSHGHNVYMGPFLISHPKFVPAFHVLSHSDEPQIPWAVIRLEFRDEQKTLAVIAPHGPQADSDAVQSGYRIAQQNCFRCHNQGRDGGQKAGRPWQVLSAWAAAAPEYFAACVHDPKSKNPHSAMTGFPNYDDATLQALIAYFRTFTPPEKP